MIYDLLTQLDRYRSPSTSASERPSSPIGLDGLYPGSGRGPKLKTNSYDEPVFDDDGDTRGQLESRGNDVPSWLEGEYLALQ